MGWRHIVWYLAVPIVLALVIGAAESADANPASWPWWIYRMGFFWD